MSKSKKASLLETFKALKDKRMLFLLLMGISSGLPFALTLGTLQAWMKDLQIDLKTIGLFAFLRLPFSLKFLWAPLMDRYAPPFLDRRRSWSAITQFSIALCLVGMALVNPTTQIHLLVILTLLLNFFSASQDIVLDAYRREVLKDEELGLGVSVFVNGYLVGFRYISGALALYLAGESIRLSYPTVYLIMAGIMAAMVFVSLAAPKIPGNLSPPQSLKDAFWGPIKDYFAKPEALTILAFIILYKVGDNMASNMTLPFIKEIGFTNNQYVAVAKFWGPIMTFAGLLVGGHFVYKLGIIKSLWVMGFFQAASTAAFAILKLTGPSMSAFAGVVAFENFTAQMGTAAYAAYMASITNKKFTATQYALLSSLMAVPGAIFASRTGLMAEKMGWIGFFIFCGIAAAPGMFLIPALEKAKKVGLVNSLRWLIISFTIVALIYSVGTSLWDILRMFVTM